MKRIFVVTWFYPPINSSEAVLTWKLLRRSRYAYDVFTQETSECWSYGTDEDFPESPNIRRICAKSDELNAWAEEAYRYFLAHYNDYDAVMTRSMPPECHLVGLRIKKRFPEKRWIASFGDPIKNNPYELIGGAYPSPDSLRHPQNRGRRLLYRCSPGRLLRLAAWDLTHRKALHRARELAALEDRTLAEADLLIFNNASQLRYMYPDADQRRAVIIPHSYDPTLFPTQAKADGDGKLRFVFTGQLNTLRCAKPLLRALARLKEDDPTLPSKAAFHLIGDMPDADLAYILRHELTDLVRVRPPVSYRQSLAELAAADCLIHIDANISTVCEENVFFAGKLADYFGAGKPILAITMQHGDAADCLRRAGAAVVSFSENEIKQALFQIICLQRLPGCGDTDRRCCFAAPTVAAKFDEEVGKLLL